jgi:hypothetical protein
MPTRALFIFDETLAFLDRDSTLKTPKKIGLFLGVDLGSNTSFLPFSRSQRGTQGRNVSDLLLRERFSWAWFQNEHSGEDTAKWTRILEMQEGEENLREAVCALLGDVARYPITLPCCPTRTCSVYKLLMSRIPANCGDARIGAGLRSMHSPGAFSYRYIEQSI